MDKPYITWSIRVSGGSPLLYLAGFHVNGEEFVMHSAHEEHSAAAEAIAAAVLRLAAKN